ncbi:MAG TPA: dihydrolipoamide acetyltransferase family protein [Actinomycetota bacterium]|nr:dihydrolipoamide acetyltransferase family protein [Actinomycetota bacterium]
MAEREFKLPDLGEGLTEGEVVRWLVAEGDAITLNQPIVEVETAKAVVEIPAPYAGTVVKLHAGEGDTLDVGAPLISVDTGGGPAGAASPAAASAPVAAEPEQELQATLVGPGERQQARRRRIGGHARSANGPRAAAPAQAPPGPAQLRPRATPPVRRYAKDRGVDLTALVGTGRDGRITREDVDGALGTAEPAAGAAGAVARQPRERSEERIPVRGTRRQIAAAITASAFSIPHVTEFLTVDATRLMELRERLRALPAAADLKLTPLAVVAKALCVAVRSFPLMNSSWDEDAGDIVVKGWVNLGIATDTPTGLLVPNIKDADTLGILDLSRELTRLTALARERKAAPTDLTGGTITITNVGGFGVETGTPIINRPECAIVATGLIAPRPWVVDGQLAVRQLMTTSVSFDHRIVDGAYAAQFLAHLRDLLEDPALLSAF